MHLMPLKPPPPPIFVSRSPEGDDVEPIDEATCHYKNIKTAVKKYHDYYHHGAQGAAHYETGPLGASYPPKCGSWTPKYADCRADRFFGPGSPPKPRDPDQDRAMRCSPTSGPSTSFHSSARRPSRQFHLNLDGGSSPASSAALRRISSTPFPWERVGREAEEREAVPPPDRAPPHPPPALALPYVPQMPTAYTFSVEPPRAVFTTDGGMSRHMLVNQSADRFAIKIRCSDNYHFRVNPVFSFLDSGSVAELEVIRLQGGRRARDRLQIVYRICRASDTDASALFGPEARVRTLAVAISTF